MVLGNAESGRKVEKYSEDFEDRNTQKVSRQRPQVVDGVNVPLQPKDEDKSTRVRLVDLLRMWRNQCGFDYNADTSPEAH